MVAQTPIYKFDVFIYKNDNISSEEFTNYMTNIYAPKAAPLVKRNGILQYAVVRQLVPPSFAASRLELTADRPPRLDGHQPDVPGAPAGLHQEQDEAV